MQGPKYPSAKLNVPCTESPVGPTPFVTVARTDPCPANVIVPDIGPAGVAGEKPAAVPTASELRLAMAVSSALKVPLTVTLLCEHEQNLSS
jgi:hypothetical protein